MHTTTNETPVDDVVIDYGFNVGDLVCHQAELDSPGVVTELDSDFDLGGVTTCRVAWGAATLEEARDLARDDQDVQWTNKLVRADAV